MDVVSACGLPVGSIVWRTWSGTFVLSVVCKATFRLRSVESQLADEQDPIIDADRTWYDEPTEALRAATDLVPFKRRAEILVVGHAHAPHGVATRLLRARLCVAGADKTIEIFAERVFTHDGRIREGVPFVKWPLLWKHASGGLGTPNPVGIRLDGPPDVYGQRLCPRIQPPGLHVTRPTDAIPIIGFGPIAPTWPGRIDKLHRHASGWDHRRWNERPLPQDIDTGYFNAAPADQQVDAIRADERIVLDNLHPELPHLVTNLSGARPEAMVERPGRPNEAAPFVCDTMVIDADRGVCSLSWRARIILDSPHAAGRVHVTLAQGTAPAFEAAIAAPAAATPLPAVSAGAGVTLAPRGPQAPIYPGMPQAQAAPIQPVAPTWPAWTSGSPPGDFPIDRCASVAASVALRAKDTAKILEENGLSEDDWDAIEHHWAQVIRKASEEDPWAAAYDRAYVLRMEQERGPITPVEYARLALAHQRDRDALTRALRDMGLPWGVTARIQRVFAERMAADATLRESVRVAMSE